MKPVGAVLYLIALLLASVVGTFMFMDVLFPFFEAASLKHPVLAGCIWRGMFAVFVVSGVLVPSRSPASGGVFIFGAMFIGVMLLILHFLA